MLVLCVTGEELAKLARIRYEQAKVAIARALAYVQFYYGLYILKTSMY